LLACILLLSLSFAIPASAEDENDSLVKSCGDIKYVMLFGNYSSPITIEDVEKATISVLESSQKEKSKPVITTCTKPGISSEIILAYCISADENGVTSTYTGKTNIEDENQNERTSEIIHGKAQEWYEKEVLKNLNDTKYSGNCSSKNTRRVLTSEEVSEIFGNSTWILPDDWMGGGKLNYPDDYEFNNYREASSSIYKQEWIPIKFPLLTW
jgi:hypothetical protein